MQSNTGCDNVARSGVLNIAAGMFREADSATKD
jgi:hypothetical protein